MNSRIKEAEERLEKALARVDAAASGRLAQGNAGERLSALELENSSLRSRQDEITTRLDNAIQRLQRALRAQ